MPKKISPDIGRSSFSIAEFCYRNHISRSTFFKLQRQKRGPRTMRLGCLVHISVEAESDWKAERENPSDAEVRLLKREADARVKASRKAAKISVASPAHVSKRRA